MVPILSVICDLCMFRCLFNALHNKVADQSKPKITEKNKKAVDNFCRALIDQENKCSSTREVSPDRMNSGNKNCAQCKDRKDENAQAICEVAEKIDAVASMCRTLLNSDSECPPCPCKSSDRKCEEIDGKDDKCQPLDDGCDVVCDAHAHKLTVGDICRDSIEHNLAKQICDLCQKKTTPKRKICFRNFELVN